MAARRIVDAPWARVSQPMDKKSQVPEEKKADKPSPVVEEQNTIVPADSRKLATLNVDANSPTSSAAVDVALLANFTHQIINPLNAVLGTIDNLIDGTIQEHRRIQRTRVVRAQLISTIELVRNLAYLSQISTEVGRAGLQAKSTGVSVPKTIIEAIQLLQEVAKANQRNVNIHLSDRSTQYTVKGHKALLKQIWMNIIENAVKYSDDNSSIEVDVRQKPAGGASGYLIVEIKNTGPGFLHDEQEKIFDLGFRGKSVQDMKASGSGLGLFICRQLLSIQDATIEAEHSNKNRLTTFRVRFKSSWIDREETDRVRAGMKDDV